MKWSDDHEVKLLSNRQFVSLTYLSLKPLVRISVHGVSACYGCGELGV